MVREKTETPTTGESRRQLFIPFPKIERASPRLYSNSLDQLNEIMILKFEIHAQLPQFSSPTLMLLRRYDIIFQFDKIKEIIDTVYYECKRIHTYRNFLDIATTPA